MPNKVIMLIFSLLVIVLLIGIYIILSPASIYITDAYCDNHGHFNFTIMNNRSSDANLTYKWELDDPKAGKPRSNDLTGSGSVTVRGINNYRIVISNLPSYNYDMRWYVLNVELFEGNTSIYHYREQKDLGGWDYSTLPPKRK